MTITPSPSTIIKLEKNIWNKCFMTLNNTKHKTVIPLRRKTIKMSSMTYLALHWVEISELWQMERERNIVQSCHWVEETKMKIGEAEVANIWGTEYQTRECYIDNVLRQSLCLSYWLFVWIPTWIYTRWSSLPPSKEWCLAKNNY